MATAISVFAAHDDDVALRDYAQSIGLALLHPYAPKLGQAENDASFQNPTQGGFFSFLPTNALHPRTTGELCEVIDPLMLYVRPHYVPGSLVAGHVFWNTDVPELARQTKPYFQKLRKWVKANWRLREDGYFIGPHAERILRDEGVKVAYMPSNVTIKTVIVD